MMTSQLMPGTKVVCNGYTGTVLKICDGQLTGMAEVRVPGGVTCVSITELRTICEVREMSKVEQINGYWCVLILSAATGRWIIQSERTTREAALADLQSWR